MKTHKKIFSVLVFAVFAVGVSGCCHVPQRVELRAPSVLPNTTRAMKTAGFWISKTADPDKIILTAQEIDALNAQTQDQKGIEDIARLETPGKGKDVAESIGGLLDSVRKRPLFTASEKKADAEFFAPVIESMDLKAIPKHVDARYGLVVHYADQRVVPTMDALYAEKNDVDFDELQNSGLDVGTVIAVLHESRDGQWLYGKTGLSGGWVRAQDVAFAGLEDVKRYAARDRIVVVIAPKADIFLNAELTEYYDYVRMGVVLPLVNEQANSVEVAVPTRNSDGALKEVSGYLKKDAVSVGFLPYTQRIIIEQAFKMLNSPYGWGGMYGEQDCSRFIQEIFSTVGIMMPRNSAAQAKVGILAAQFSDETDPRVKTAALKHKAVAGITTLYMKGHIMLYLGSVDGRDFAIHAPWGYREACPGGESGHKCHPEVFHVINRVVVSDLSLGEGSWKKSLLERLLTIRRIDEGK